MNNKTLHPLLESLNVDKTAEEQLEDLQELIESYDPEEKEELKEQITDINEKISYVLDEIGGYVKHFRGVFFTDGKEYPMIELYDDMDEMAKDVVKTLELLKDQLK
jgi:hypothetical protein